ncbi:MAG: metal ABC transporter permease [Bacteroidaceae bacterium]|nr:metal ABC transporter permease [Bacteroidaceae bacterium]
MKELLQYAFFQNALIGCLLTGIVCGLVGSYIVARRMVFISGGIAHASLGGIGLCALLGLPPITGAAIFSLFTGYSVQTLSQRSEIREDSAIAMLWAFGMSIGILCAYLSPSFLPSLSNYLFGNILLINTGDLLFLSVLTAITILVFTLLLHPIVSIAFDREFALSQQLPVVRIELLIMTIICLSVVACLRVAGVVMVISLMSIPQITAGLFTRHFSTMAILSATIAILCCLGGLMISYFYNVPSGASIILLSTANYLILRTIKGIKACLYK